MRRRLQSYGNFTTISVEDRKYVRNLHGDVTGGCKDPIVQGAESLLTLSKPLVREKRSPAVYGLRNCTKTRYEDCAAPCPAQLTTCNESLGSNCTCF